ncbi:PREDICTED: uncharacterized mitochondrial protein AtMg00810-like [Rhagoletis zephyria]|uniref:uncharacterized mitochondrial protein AtMg00810-like n=1 Tax=Rhagoletis zephyria TaxID=28612 RepID=UPI000811469C|nr:PREDICTED: uncharacterized mitochondrial protein AtMg00810-like [Rhagoletis zephyria]
MGFTPCASEPCVYIKNKQRKYNIIAVYVDDLLLASSNLRDLNDIETKISKEFDILDGGPAKYFLGMEIERDGDVGNIAISQRQYIYDLLMQNGMEECKAVSKPLEVGFQTSCDKDACSKVNRTEYQSLIGALVYLAISTRPDFLHSVSKLAQRNTDPHIEHKTAAKHILRYLKGTAEFKLHYKKTDRSIECFVDADWGEMRASESHTLVVRL